MESKDGSLYIYSKNKVHIIDLAQTVQKMEEAKKFIESVVKDGGNILFIGTKKQAQTIVKEEAERCGMPYVSERWLGGMLTNFQTIASRTKYLKDMERKVEEGTGMTKKEKLKIEQEIGKLQANLGGILDITRLPNAVFIVDIQKEMTALKEAKKIGLPVVAIVDTNVNPELVDYPIPANDDAVKAIKMICEYMADAVSKTPVKKVSEEDAGMSKKEESRVGEKPKGEAKEEPTPNVVETKKTEEKK